MKNNDNTQLSPIYLTIDATKSGLPIDTPVYLYIIGLVISSGVNTFYWIDANGMPQEMKGTDNANDAGTFPGSGLLSPGAAAALVPNYPLAWANYSIPVSLSTPFEINLTNINTTNIPGLGTGTAAFSGRAYISVGVPTLPFSVSLGNDGNVIGYTAPVFTNPPGYLTLFDWIEFAFDSNQNFWGNTTMVDQFGLPLSLNGTQGGVLQGELNEPRDVIMNAFGSGTGAFNNGALQVAMLPAAASAYPSGINYFRVVSPKTISAPASYSGPLTTFFDSQIQQWYQVWQTTPLVTHDTATGYYTGVVPTEGANAGILTFYQGNYPTLEALQSAKPPVAFLLTGLNPSTNIILTADIWQCANTLANGSAGGAAQLNVGKIIAAAFNRGFVSCYLDDATCESCASQFYPTGGTWNGWSQMFHSFNVNGLAYGFPYDDVCNQSSSIALAPTTSVIITLGALSAREFFFTVDSKKAWQDTGLVVPPGATVTINYQSGLWTANPNDNNHELYDANGNPVFIEAKPGYTMPGQDEGALIGKIGDTVFLVGDGISLPGNTSGNLSLCINDDLDGRYGPGLQDNMGSVTILIDING